MRAVEGRSAVQMRVRSTRFTDLYLPLLGQSNQIVGRTPAAHMRVSWDDEICVLKPMEDVRAV